MRRIILLAVALSLLGADDADARKRKKRYRKPPVKVEKVQPAPAPNVFQDTWLEGGEPMLYADWHGSKVVGMYQTPFDRRWYFAPPEQPQQTLISYHQAQVKPEYNPRSFLIVSLLIGVFFYIIVFAQPMWDRRLKRKHPSDF